MVNTLHNVMDFTTDDLDRIFGKNGDSEDDFEIDPSQMAADNSPDEYDLMEDELKRLYHGAEKQKYDQEDGPMR